MKRYVPCPQRDYFELTEAFYFAFPKEIKTIPRNNNTLFQRYKSLMGRKYLATVIW